MGLFTSNAKLYGAAIALRIVLLVYGTWQDAHSPVKYTDIDYLVFTDAARYVAWGQSPYLRDTYRYTPLVAWLLVPTAWDERLFVWGKVVFAVADVVAGWLVVRALVGGRSRQLQGQEGTGMSVEQARKYVGVCWLLNPMVANISTRGSSEGVLALLVVAMVWAVLRRRVTLAGVLLGLSVHLKIYPFVYGGSLLLALPSPASSSSSTSSTGPKGRAEKSLISRALEEVTFDRVHLTLTALATFSALNLSMYILYGMPFLQHTYLHHLTRIDHRHNFSPYGTLLYLASAGDVQAGFESVAFIPQLLLSVVVIPLVLARKSLPGAMLAQTFAFVTFNKVCTSQYFLWYLVFLPFYLPGSSLMRNPRLGLTVLALWVGAQAAWLQQGYNLEFLGLSSFVPGLFLAGLGFFAVNVWILGIIISDLGGLSVSASS